VTLNSGVMILKITGINYNLKYITTQKKTVLLNCDHITQHFCFYCVFDQLNAALVSKRVFQKTKSYPPQTFEQYTVKMYMINKL